VSQYVHRYYLFADAAGADWVRALFATMGDGGPGEDGNCRVPLSPAADPAAPPVAWCASFACTDAQHRTLGLLAALGQIPAGVVWCRVDAASGLVLATNYAPAADRVGRPWDLPTALALVGLAFHTGP